MTLTTVSGTGLWYPVPSPVIIPSSLASLTIDAATEKAAHMGSLFIDGRPTSSKTISAAGGGSISFRTGAVTFANSSTTVDIGLQGVSSSSGPEARPDGVFTTKVTLTGGGGGLATNAWNTVALTGGSGSATLNQGDPIAVVWDMTARAGADSVLIASGIPQYSGNNTAGMWPLNNAFTGGTWNGGLQGLPNIVLTFNDGTLGFIDGAWPLSAPGLETYTDATNPDERGLIFQVPWACAVDAFFVDLGGEGNNSDMTIKLYSDPTGTPTALSTVTVLGEQLGQTFTPRIVVYTLPTQISLSPNTDYCLAVKATGTFSVELSTMTLGSATHQKFFPGGTTVKKATRNNASGAFSGESPALTRYQMGVRLSQLNDLAMLGRSRVFTGM